MKTIRSIILVTALASAACADAPAEEQSPAVEETTVATVEEAAPPPPALADTTGELSGFWVAWLPGGIVLRLHLGESADGTVAGTGSLVSGNLTADFTVSGRHAAPDLELVMRKENGDTARFSGKVDEATGHPAGTFTAFGGRETPVTIQRETTPGLP